MDTYKPKESKRNAFFRALGATAIRATAEYDTRVKIREKMDDILSAGQCKLTCGKCEDVCSCPTCATLNNALTAYLTEFQESGLSSPRGTSPQARHVVILASVATERFGHDKQLYDLFRDFVAKLWWLAATSD